MSDVDPQYQFIAPGSFELGDMATYVDKDGVVRVDYPANSDAIERMAERLEAMNRAVAQVFDDGL